MKEQLEQVIKSVAQKASETKSADEALKFTQAALNAAHALSIIVNAGK